MRGIKIQSHPWANHFRDPISEKTITKRGVTQEVGTKFKSQYHQKKRGWAFAMDKQKQLETRGLQNASFPLSLS
jgi:hypothetical protein